MHAQHAEVRTAKITLVFKIKYLRMLGCSAPLARTAQDDLRDESGKQKICPMPLRGFIAPARAE